jgi:hypothetical protein
MKVGRTLLTVPGRVLPSPDVVYQGGQLYGYSTEGDRMLKGGWNLTQKRFLLPRPLGAPGPWLALNLTGRRSDAFDTLLTALGRSAAALGMSFGGGGPPPPHRADWGGAREAPGQFLQRVWDEVGRKAGGRAPSLVVALLPGECLRENLWRLLSGLLYVFEIKGRRCLFQAGFLTCSRTVSVFYSS